MSEQSRRDILKQMAGTAAAGVGLAATGTGAAAQRVTEIETDDAGATNRRRLMHPQTGPLLEVLAEEGIIGTATTQAIATDSTGMETVTAGREGVGSYRLRTDSGTRAATVSLTHVSGGVLRVYVDSESRPVALYQPDEGPDTVYYPDGSSIDIGIRGEPPCCGGYNCVPFECSSGGGDTLTVNIPARFEDCETEPFDCNFFLVGCC